MVSFYNPWNSQKNSGLLDFSEGLERDQWHKMDQQEILR